MKRASQRANAISREVGRKRRVHLVVIESDVPSFAPVNTVPSDESGCPDTTIEFCRHIKCRWHLARIDGSDRAGRKGLRGVPRNDRGLTVSAPGVLDDDRVTTLEPLWLVPGAPSCALHEARKGARTNSEIGAATNRHRTLIARIVKRALRSLAAQGITAEQLEMLLPGAELKRTEPSRRSK